MNSFSKIFVNVLTLWLCSILGKAQTFNSEINIAGFKIETLKSSRAGDSAFFSLDLIRFETGPIVSNKSFWIYPDGSLNEIQVPELKDKNLLKAFPGDTARYYIIDERRGKFELQVVSVPGNNRPTEPIATLNSQILGSYIEGDDLVILTAEPTTFEMQLLRINKYVVSGRQSFKLPIDLGSFPKNAISFYGGDIAPSLGQAKNPVKIIKDKENITLCIDVRNKQMETEKYQTVVIQNNLRTNTTTHKIIEDAEWGYVNSTVFNNRLYRVRQFGGLHFDIFDLETRKKIYSQSLVPRKEKLNGAIYHRNGLHLTTEKTTGSLDFILKSGRKALIMVDSLDANKIIVTLGIHGESKEGFPVLFFAGAPILLATAVAFHVFSNGPRYYHYFYLSGSKSKGFDLATDLTGLKRSAIDEYEILNGKNGIINKYYLNTPHQSYGIYQYKGASKLEVVTFR